MALSFTSFTGDGSNKNFAVSFSYLSRDHVSLTVNDTPVSFSWLNDSLVQAAVAPPAGSVVKVKRTTPINSPMVDFVDASTLVETDLDTTAKQHVYLSQEASDRADAALTLDIEGNFEGRGKRIRHVASPTATDDATNKDYVDSNITERTMTVDTADGFGAKGFRIVNVHDPVAGSDASTKSYVDARKAEALSYADSRKAEALSYTDEKLGEASAIAVEMQGILTDTTAVKDAAVSAQAAAASSASAAASAATTAATEAAANVASELADILADTTSVKDAAVSAQSAAAGSASDAAASAAAAAAAAGGSPVGSVVYNASQSLSDVQKAQARHNVGLDIGTDVQAFTNPVLPLNAGSSSTNDTALNSFELSSGPMAVVPKGAYPTSKNFYNGLDITKQYYGFGQLKDASGHRRGKWVIPVTEPVKKVSHYGDATTWYDGDWDKSGLAIEQIVQTNPIQTGTLTTSGATAAGSNVLHFDPAPDWVGVGSDLSYRSLSVIGTNIPADTRVTGIDTVAKTVTISAAVTGAGVASGASIIFGGGSQYITVPETAPISVRQFVRQDSLGGNGPGRSCQNIYGIQHLAFNDSGNPGGVWGLNAGGTVTRASADYDPANPYASPQVGILTGVANTAVDDVYLAPCEWEISDQGHRTTGIGLVLDFARTYSGSQEHGVPGQFWKGLLLNAGASTKALDAGLALAGPFVTGIDFCHATIPDSQAIVMKQGQGISWNATPGTFIPSSMGAVKTHFNGSTLLHEGSHFTIQEDNSAALILNSNVGTSNYIIFQTGGASRWMMYKEWDDASLSFYDNTNNTNALNLSSTQAYFSGQANTPNITMRGAPSAGGTAPSACIDAGGATTFSVANNGESDFLGYLFAGMMVVVNNDTGAIGMYLWTTAGGGVLIAEVGGEFVAPTTMAGLASGKSTLSTATLNTILNKTGATRSYRVFDVKVR